MVEEEAIALTGIGNRFMMPKFRLMAAVISSSGVQPFSRAAAPTALPIPIGPST